MCPRSRCRDGFCGTGKTGMRAISPRAHGLAARFEFLLFAFVLAGRGAVRPPRDPRDTQRFGHCMVLIYFVYVMVRCVLNPAGKTATAPKRKAK